MQHFANCCIYTTIGVMVRVRYVYLFRNVSTLKDAKSSPALFVCEEHKHLCMLTLLQSSNGYPHDVSWQLQSFIHRKRLQKRLILLPSSSSSSGEVRGPKCAKSKQEQDILTWANTYRQKRRALGQACQDSHSERAGPVSIKNTEKELACLWREYFFLLACICMSFFG